MAKPGDTIVVDGVEFIAGDDRQWHPNTSMGGQLAQSAIVDLPTGAASILDLVGGVMRPVPGAPAANLAPLVQQGTESFARKLGVNVIEPQTRAQGYARALGGQVPPQVGIAAATGGGSLLAQAAGAAAGTVAGEAIRQGGGGALSQIGGGVATDLLVTAATKNPRQMLSLTREFGKHVANPRFAKALAILDPLDIASEGSAKLMRDADSAHIAARTHMDQAYEQVGKASGFRVGADRLSSALNQMLQDAGSIRSPRIDKTIAARLEELISKPNGVSFDDIRALQKDVNAALSVNPERIAEAGAAERIGQLRAFVIPAIQQTYDDMVAAGQFAAAKSPTGKARRAVNALRAANKIAEDYYTTYDKRSQLVRQLVDGVSGGQALDPQKAMRKVFSDPKQGVENARNIMAIVGRNPQNVSIMRRSFVETTLSADVGTFSPADALKRASEMKAVGVEILGKDGYEHYLNVLRKMKDRPEPLSSANAVRAGRGAGLVAGSLSGIGSPWIAGLIGAGIGDVSARGFNFIRNHFGDAAAEQLAKESMYDPQVYAMIVAKVHRYSPAQLAQWNSSVRAAMLRSGIRAAGALAPRQPMLPSEMNQGAQQP